MAGETDKELAAKLAEGAKKAQASKISDAANTHGKDSDEAWQALTGDTDEQ